MQRRHRLQVGSVRRFCPESTSEEGRSGVRTVLPWLRVGRAAEAAALLAGSHLATCAVQGRPSERGDTECSEETDCSGQPPELLGPQTWHISTLVHRQWLCCLGVSGRRAGGGVARLRAQWLESRGRCQEAEGAGVERGGPRRPGSAVQASATCSPGESLTRNHWFGSVLCRNVLVPSTSVWIRSTLCLDPASVPRMGGCCRSSTWRSRPCCSSATTPAPAGGPAATAWCRTASGEGPAHVPRIPRPQDRWCQAALTSESCWRHILVP